LIEQFEIDGFKVNSNVLNRTQYLSVEVTEPELIDEGFFSSSYMSYNVRTSPLEKDVRRRD